MIDTVVIGGYCFLTLTLMFGCKRRRSFAEASHTAAAFVVVSLCLVALTLFVAGSICHLAGAQHSDIAQRRTALFEDR
jgi:hypothetical protein